LAVPRAINAAEICLIGMQLAPEIRLPITGATTIAATVSSAAVLGSARLRSPHD
jgi:hypothetical protein